MLFHMILDRRRPRYCEFRSTSSYKLGRQLDNIHRNAKKTDKRKKNDHKFQQLLRRTIWNYLAETVKFSFTSSEIILITKGDDQSQLATILKPRVSAR